MRAERSDGSELAIVHEQADVFGGTERVLAAVLERFPRAEIVAASFAAERGGDPAPSWTAEARLLRFKGRRRHFLAPLYARRIADVSLADARVVLSLTHAGWSLAAAVPAGARHLCYSAGPPRNLYGHTDSYLRDYPRGLRPLLRRAVPLLRSQYRGLIRNVDRVLVNSAWSARQLAARTGVSAEIVFPPVDTSFFSPSDASERRHVLVVARAVAHKRLDVVLEAFRRLDQPLVVAGTGSWLQRLRESAPPNVRFAGFVPDEELRELYRGALALVHPCAEEFGIAMAEAQSCGVPVIAPGVGGALEIVRDGETGILLDRVDAESIASAVRGVAERRFSAAACRATVLRYDKERFVERVGDIVEEELALTAMPRRRAEQPRTARPDLARAQPEPR